MIKQLRYVTKKLKDQSLKEPPHNGAENVHSEDRDSGTESDDEQTCEDHEPEIPSEMSSEVSSGCSVRSRPTSQTSTDTVTCDDLPLAGDAHDMPPPTHTNMPHAHHLTHPHHRRARTPRHPQYTRRTPEPPSNSRESPEIFCNPPFVSDCDPVEHHSSEEELETLTGSWPRDNGPPEKRKWSQVARPSLTDSGSSDDEVGGLTTGSQHPVQFITSPPLEAHKPLRTVSPPSKMLSLATSSRQTNNTTSAEPTECGHCAGVSPNVEGNGLTAARSEGAIARAASPRKRHRNTPRPSRPCLDFEKMQQMKTQAVTHWRSNGELSLSSC